LSLEKKSKDNMSRFLLKNKRSIKISIFFFKYYCFSKNFQLFGFDFLRLLIDFPILLLLIVLAP